MTPRISIAMIAHNEESTVAGALASAAWADEIILVDCGSTDGTAAAAAGAPKVRHFSRENSLAVHVNKQFAADQASGDWIFILDADEEITEELRDEIISAVSSGNAPNAYEMPRRNFYFGRWLKHGGKYPDTQLRLFRKGRARFIKRPVHERLDVSGGTGRLASPLLHYPYRSVSDIPRKLGFYSEALSENYLEDRRHPLLIFFRPFTRFISAYFLKLGFMDGGAGFKTALTDFYVIFLSIFRYREKLAEGGKVRTPEKA
ncbi:MAG TPA: glycosyltransferase family 2 protein [Elusimicrobiales bacterium]|nr:glycosyltransferase family 2 protein [Elusimicrobiales bacterium]